MFSVRPVSPDARARQPIELAEKVAQPDTFALVAPPEIAAPLSRPFHIPELAGWVARHAQGPELFTWLKTQKSTAQLCQKKWFWQGKVTQRGWQRPGDASLDAGTLRRRYQHMHRAIDAVQAGRVLPAHRVEMTWPRDNIVSGPLSTSLRFDTNTRTQLTSVHSLHDVLPMHSDVPQFEGESLFDDGRLCMGYEAGRGKVVRRVADWALVAALDEVEGISVWSAMGPHNDILLRHQRAGNDAGSVQVWSACATQLKATFEHFGANGWAMMPCAGRVITLNTADHTVRIWNAADGTLFSAFEVPDAVMVHRPRGDVLWFSTEKDGKQDHVYVTDTGAPARQALQQHIPKGSPRWWETFSDGTHVLGYSGALLDGRGTHYYFDIVAADGTKIGSFEHPFVRDCIVFMDRYVVTSAYAGDLRIWSQTGARLVNADLNFGCSFVVDDGEGKLIAFDSVEGVLLASKAWDFGAPTSRSGLRV